VQQPTDCDFTSVFITVQDGLRLHLRDYGSPATTAFPLICLPGLTRTSADFHQLASALACDPTRPRRVLALDCRGRGLSDYDRNPRGYVLEVELADLLSVLAALEIEKAVVIGTSRGGLLAMLLAAQRPNAIAGVVFNDIGPVIEAAGLVRIKKQIETLPLPRSFEEGADILRRLNAAQFPKFTPDDWVRISRLTFRKSGRHFVTCYDPKLASTLEGVDLRPLPAFWPQFDALAHVPLMVIRGANSDILSSSTIEAMRARRPDLTVIEVPDQGHAPLLDDSALIARICKFLALCDPSAIEQDPTDTPAEQTK
jgi:pimeloyl-ACP methyl ester carboxylesterase